MGTGTDLFSGRKNPAPLPLPLHSRSGQDDVDTTYISHFKRIDHANIPPLYDTEATLDNVSSLKADTKYHGQRRSQPLKLRPRSLVATSELRGKSRCTRVHITPGGQAGMDRFPRKKADQFMVKIGRPELQALVAKTLHTLFRAVCTKQTVIAYYAQGSAFTNNGSTGPNRIYRTDYMSCKIHEELRTIYVT